MAFTAIPTMHRVTSGLTNTLSGAKQLAWPVLGGVFFLIVALVLGAIAAMYPPTFAVKLGMLVGGGVVFVTALLVPAHVVAPLVLVRRLLFTLVLVNVAWPIYLSYHGLPGPAINPTRLVYWSLAGLWFFWFVASRDLRTLLFARLKNFGPFPKLLVVYLVWALFCATLSATPFFSIYYFIKLMIGPLLIFLVALSCLRDRRDVDSVLLLMVIAALFAVALGMVEALWQKNLFFDIMPSLFPQGDEGESSWAEKLAGDKSRDGAYRVMSTFTHPLTFGEYLALALPLAVYQAGFASRLLPRLIGLVTIPAIMAGLYVAHTRSPLLAAGVVLLGLVGFLGVRGMRQKRSFAGSAVAFFVLIAAMLAVVGLIGIALELAAGRSVSEAGSTVARMIMFQLGGALVLEQPLVGYGPGMAAVTLGFLPGFTVLTIDSFYLSIAMESGLPGLALFVGLLSYVVIKGFFAGVATAGRDGARLGVIVLALLGFSVVKTVLSLTENMDAVFLLIALLAVSLEPAARNAERMDDFRVNHGK